MKLLFEVVSIISTALAYLAVYYEIGLHCDLADTVFWSFIFTAVATWLIVYAVIEVANPDDFPENMFKD